MKKLLYLLPLMITLFFTRCEQDVQELGLMPSTDASIQPLNTQTYATTAFNGRIAISADGNDHDRDDIGATPLGLAVIAHLGLQNKLVYYDYNSHIWGSASSSQKNDMTESTLGAASRFGFNKSVFISAIDETVKAEKSLADAINNSSSSNPLYIILAGPAAVICKGIKRSDPAKRKYVTVISHHINNENHTHDSNNACIGDDIKQSGVNFVRINNQNYNFSTQDWSEYAWLKNHSNSNLRWVYDRMKVAFDYKADVSDMGMIWYLLKNDQKGIPNKLKSFFGSSSPKPDPKDPKPDPKDPKPDPKDPKPDPKDPKPNPKDPKPNPAPDRDNCQAYGSTLIEAARNLEERCGVKYDKSKGHDCDPDGKGGWICSTENIGSSGGSSYNDKKGSSNGDDCQAYGRTNIEAQRNFEKHCGMKYDKSKGHDCDPDGKGGWICSTSEL